LYRISSLRVTFHASHVSLANGIALIGQLDDLVIGSGT
jgi:hypothetical protein